MGPGILGAGRGRAGPREMGRGQVETGLVPGRWGGAGRDRAEPRRMGGGGLAEAGLGPGRLGGWGR